MNEHLIVRNVHRPSQETIDALAPLGAATVHEAIGRRGFLGPRIRPIQSGVRIAGSAITVSSHPGDNLMIHAAIEFCQPGDILVVSTTSASTNGMFGDLFASSLRSRGVRGVVIDAGVRDTQELREMNFPVWSQYVSCQGTVKASPGSVNVPIVLGEQRICPGDVICADDDGVVVVARSEADRALEKSIARLAKEEVTRARLVAGELGVDFYGLRPKLAELGVRYVDSLGEVDESD